MEATIVVELLRDAFALIEFVQTTAATIRNHEEERSDLNLKFRAQELRLRQLYRLFEGADEDPAVIARLEDVPEVWRSHFQKRERNKKKKTKQGVDLEHRKISGSSGTFS
jgi:hypothetical protein